MSACAASPDAPVKVGSWTRVAALGNGRTGRVSLYVEPISAEGAGAVHGSPDEKARKLHAIKRVRRQDIVSASAARRVLAEKNALEALKSSSGVVNIRCTSKDDQCLYFVLEALLGAKFYASEVVSAIAEMHALGYMHRDLKASNVVLCARGHAKLVDLGCAGQLTMRAQHEDETTPSGDKSYTYCGTLHCMAPEMISRDGHTAAVDWWACGILIHEMITGEPMFGYEGGDLPQRIMAGIPVEDEDLARKGCQQTDTESDGEARVSPVLPIVRRLLDTNPERRLGGRQGANEVCSHAWFDATDWRSIARLEVEPPPFRRDLGELDALGAEDTGEGNVDPDGLFDDF